MDGATVFATALAALVVEALVGYPDAVFRTIGHPVTWIGALIGWLDRHFNRPELRYEARRFAGVVALSILITVAVACGYAIERLAGAHSLGVPIVVLAASTLFASRSLYTHVHDVSVAVAAGGLIEGRKAVARIVGRDPETLDEAGVCRAAIESLAENASDGVVAPVIWFLIAGLPGLVAYKAINTADSMIGHRSEKYEAFGWAAARLDDLVNLPASRLTGVLFALAAGLLPGGHPKGAVEAMLRDASGHRSPNAGWPESAMAGALGLQLNGPRSYGGVMTNDAYMGNGRRDASARDVRRALTLSTIAWALMLSSIAGAWLIGRM
jgi:adenosylcobinamide-phosphate synthase